MNDRRSPFRVARYLRVSRADQDLALQEDETARLIEQRGWKLVGTYRDAGVSGARDRRPALDELLADARRGRFDSVVVYRADRLARSLRHLITVVGDLGDWGVAFTSASEPFDTASPTGKLLLSIVGAMAEFERSILIERTRAGLAATRKRGTRLGRPRVQFDVDRAIALRREGLSYKKVAATLGVSVGVVHGVLRDAGVHQTPPTSPSFAEVSATVSTA